MESETKVPAKSSKPAKVETEATPDTRSFFRISAREYLTMLPPFSVTLYPGSSAVIAVESPEEIPSSYYTLLDIKPITKLEYEAELAEQGILGKP